MMASLRISRSPLQHAFTSFSVATFSDRISLPSVKLLVHALPVPHALLHPIPRGSFWQLATSPISCAATTGLLGT